jgi:hypothetical protein
MGFIPNDLNRLNDLNSLNSFKPMNVLIVTGIFPPDIGGPSTYVPTISGELVKRGHKVSVVTLSDTLDHDDHSLSSLCTVSGEVSPSPCGSCLLSSAFSERDGMRKSSMSTVSILSQ